MPDEIASCSAGSTATGSSAWAAVRAYGLAGLTGVVYLDTVLSKRQPLSRTL